MFTDQDLQTLSAQFASLKTQADMDAFLKTKAPDEADRKQFLEYYDNVVKNDPAQAGSPSDDKVGGSKRPDVGLKDYVAQQRAKAENGDPKATAFITQHDELVAGIADSLPEPVSFYGEVLAFDEIDGRVGQPSYHRLRLQPLLDPDNVTEGIANRGLPITVIFGQKYYDTLQEEGTLDNLTVKSVHRFSLQHKKAGVTKYVNFVRGSGAIDSFTHTRSGFDYVEHKPAGDDVKGAIAQAKLDVAEYAKKSLPSMFEKRHAFEDKDARSERLQSYMAGLSDISDKDRLEAMTTMWST